MHAHGLDRTHDALLLHHAVEGHICIAVWLSMHTSLNHSMRNTERPWRMGRCLEALPGQAPVEQEHERVGQALQVIAPAGCAAQVRVHARVSYGAPAARVHCSDMEHEKEGAL